MVTIGDDGRAWWSKLGGGVTLGSGVGACLFLYFHRGWCRREALWTWLEVPIGCHEVMCDCWDSNGENRWRCSGVVCLRIPFIVGFCHFSRILVMCPSSDTTAFVLCLSCSTDFDLPGDSQLKYCVDSALIGICGCHWKGRVAFGDGFSGHVSQN